jgi:hypothetical protein
MSKAAEAASQQQQQAEKDKEQKPVTCVYQCPFKLTGPTVEFEGYNYQTFGMQDFLSFRNLADSVEGWKLRFDENGTYTWDKKQEGEPMKMIKVFGVVPDATPALLYDVMHDPVYRIVWDERRLDGYRFTLLAPNCEIGYYAGKLGFALSDREFVNQRGWINPGNGEYIIWNTSVPVRRLAKEGKDRIRAISKVSGYLIRPWGDKGSSLTYVTQADPRGMIPSSIINFVTTRFAPGTIVTLGNACRKYPEWAKQQGDKHTRPWLLQADGTTNPTPYPTPQKNVIYEWIASRTKDGVPPPPPPQSVASPGPASPSSPSGANAADAGGVNNYWVEPASPTPLAAGGAAPAAASGSAAAAASSDNKTPKAADKKEGDAK